MPWHASAPGSRQAQTWHHHDEKKHKSQHHLKNVILVAMWCPGSVSQMSATWNLACRWACGWDQSWDSCRCCSCGGAAGGACCSHTGSRSGIWGSCCHALSCCCGGGNCSGSCGRGHGAPSAPHSSAAPQPLTSQQQIARQHAVR